MDTPVVANEDMSYVNDASLDDGYVTDEDAEKKNSERTLSTNISQMMIRLTTTNSTTTNF